jgi:hypothetical protein
LEEEEVALIVQQPIEQVETVDLGVVAAVRVMEAHQQRQSVWVMEAGAG